MAYRTLALVAALLLVLSGCRGAEMGTQEDDTYEQTTRAQRQLPSDDAIPAGTDLRVELDQELSSEKTQKGDRFTATLLYPLVGPDGDTVVPAGAEVRGDVTGIASSNRPDEQAAIRLNVDEIVFDGESYEMPAKIVEADVETDRDKSDIATGAAIGGVAGAALGAVIGQDVKGALIGGALGAGAGTVISLGVGRVDAVLPAGTEMTLQTTDEVELN